MRAYSHTQLWVLAGFIYYLILNFFFSLFLKFCTFVLPKI